MNPIPQLQTAKRQLERLAAQRIMYSDAKTVLAVQMVLAVPCAILLSILVAVYPQFRVYALAWGIIVSLADAIFLSRLSNAKRRDGAKVQELFDCEVLQLPWNDLKVGHRPDPEVVADLANRYKRQDPGFGALQPWYSLVVGTIPMEFGRLVCQRSNCRWDGALRQRYAAWVGAILAGLTLVVFLVGLIGGFSLEKLIMAVLAPLLPAFLLGVRLIYDHLEAAASVDRLKEHADNLWGAALDGHLTPVELDEKARRLQDEIYDHRRKAPLVFDWIYKKLRRKHEDEMNTADAVMVEEWTAKKP